MKAFQWMLRIVGFVVLTVGVVGCASTSKKADLTALIDKAQGKAVESEQTMPESLLSTTKPTPDAVNILILKHYAAVESYCALKKAKYISEQDANTKKESHITAWGQLITLIGGVTVYVPGKAILMGLGIGSSGGGSGSVLGGMVNSINGSDDLTKNAEASLVSGYETAIKAFDAIQAGSDADGMGRFKLLLQAKAACDGL